jgi:hypothetical protein
MGQTRQTMASTSSRAAGAQVHDYDRCNGKRALGQDSCCCFDPLVSSPTSHCRAVAGEAQPMCLKSRPWTYVLLLLTKLACAHRNECVYSCTPGIRLGFSDALSATWVCPAPLWEDEVFDRQSEIIEYQS